MRLPESNTPRQGERLLTIAQSADRLQISERSVRRMISAGLLPAVRLGRLVRIHPRDLRALERPD
jgi:excisionase family DNA binding protein